MLERIRNVISWLRELRAYWESRYPSESPVVTPTPDRRSRLRRWWDLNRGRILRDLVVCLLALNFAVVLTQYYVIWRVLSDTNLLTSDELGFILGSDFFLSGSIRMPVYFALGIVAVLCILLRASRSVTLGWHIGATVAIGICIALNTQYSDFEEVIIRHQSAVLYQKAVKEFQTGEYPVAERLFSSLLRTRRAPALDDEIKGWLIGIDYWEGDYVAATEAACRFLAEYGDSEIVDEITTTLHWSIYGLGHSLEFEEAVSELEKIRSKMGLVCYNEASPFWLAISPDVYYRAIATLSNEQEYRLPEGIYFSDRYSAWIADVCARLAYCEDLERLQGDFATLARLVARYPEEPGRDIALYILGQFDDIHPDSPLYDAALMASGIHDEYAGHADRAAWYFDDFLEAFPHHRWRAEARVHRARCLSAQDDFGQAILEYARLIHEFSGGLSELANVEMAEEESEHLIREHIDLATLRLLIKANPTDEAIGEFKYWLGVKLFHERFFQDARAIFVEVQHDSPMSRAASRASEHIQTIDSLEPISQLQRADFLFEMARWYIAQVGLMSPGELPLVSGLTVFKVRLDIPASLLNSPIGFDRTSYPLAYDRQALLMAARYFDEFIESFPDDLRIADVLLGQGGIYEALGYGTLGDESLQLHDQSVQAYRRYLELFPERDVAGTEKAITKIALIYLNKPVRVNAQDLQLMRENGRWLMQNFPNHHLANNILNWIGWSYCLEANMHPFDSPEYETY